MRIEVTHLQLKPELPRRPRAAAHLLSVPISFVIKPASTVVIRGPNGVGKTTLVRYLVGLEPVSHGSILWDDAEAPIGPVAYLCQRFDRAVLGWRSPIENIRFVCPDKDHLAKYERKLGELIDDAACRCPMSGGLSYGLQHAAAVLSTVAAPGRLMVLDEPFSGMDQKVRQTVADWVVQEGRKRTVVVATHVRPEDLEVLGVQIHQEIHLKSVEEYEVKAVEHELA